MKLFRTPLVAGLAAVGMAAMTLPLSGCKAEAAPPPASPAAASPAEATLVTLAPARKVKSSPREEVTGTLFPAQALMVGFEVGGRLDKVRVKKGQRVQEGQVLAQLNPEISDAQLAQAQAAVAAAEVASAMATDVAGRQAKLQQQGNVSDLQNLTASTQARQAEAQLLAARAQLAQAQAGRRRHDLKAPFSGTVVDAPEQVGAIVGPGVPLFSVENLGSLLLKTTVSDSLRERLKPGTRVRVEVIGGGASSEEATLRTIIPSADAATHRIPVDILVPNKEGRFVANMLARVILPLGEAQDAQALPTSALSSSGGDHVLVVSPAGQVHRVDVQVLERGMREVVVKAASPLEQVVDSPAPSLVEGARVSVK